MSHTPSPSNPAERLATVFAWILAATRRGLGRNAARLEGPVQIALLALVGRRLTQARERFARLAERIKAGWVYQPKPYAPRKQAAETADRPRRTKNPLTTGSLWLVRAAPGHDTDGAAADLRNLLAEPEVAAVLAAAPVPAWRILRSVYWMLGVEKPPALAPAKPPKPRKPACVPPPPPPWEVLPPTPDASYYHRAPSFFWPWIGPKPKTA